MIIFILLLALDINSGIIEALLVILSNNDKIFLCQGNILNINVVLVFCKNYIRLPLSSPVKLCCYGPKEKFSVLGSFSYFNCLIYPKFGCIFCIIYIM